MDSPPVSLPDLANALRSGELRLSNYLVQLESLFEHREPSVMAFVPEEGRFERLRLQAEELCQRYPQPEKRPPLFGVPIGVKDVFHVDGLVTRAGSRLPIDQLQGAEAESVTILKEAGALALGKTVSTEFAYVAPGPTRNPHNTEHTPGGSSSGSAVAVASRLCPLALGTQTIGSTIRPASFCGIVGYKPSFNRIPTGGLIHLSPSLDHVGVFTVDVAGAMLAASLLCREWQPRALPPRPILGIPEGPYLARVSEEGLTHLEATCKSLTLAGYEIRAVEAMPDFEDIVARHRLIVAAEAAQVHQEWFAPFGEIYHPTTAQLIVQGQSISEEALQDACDGRARLRDELIDLMEDNDIDLWLSPASVGPAPRGLESTGDPVMNLPWTHSGMPALNLPSGANVDGLPMGLQLTARWYEDELLLAWAEGIEAVLMDA
ncbi:MAG: amidase [Chloroflexi bacterium]|nr:amidase [Chloroflexota bacterium]